MEYRLDYYRTREDFIRYVFYRVPKILFTAVPYRGISFDARMFFIFLLDRANLSAQNGWIDETGRVYIFFTLSAAMLITGYGHNKVCRIFTELEKAGMIERIRQGQGKPMKIYVKNPFKPFDAAGNPMTFDTVPLAPSECGLEGQLSFLPEMDATEQKACEMEETAALSVEESTVLSAEEASDSPILGLYPVETAEQLESVDLPESAMRDVEPDTSVVPADDSLADYAQAGYMAFPSGATESPVEGNVENVESCGKLSTFVENFDSEPAEQDASDASAPLCASEKGKSGLPETGSQDFRKPEPNQTKRNKNEFTKNPSYPPAPLTGRGAAPDAGGRRTRRRRTGEEWMEDMRNCREEVCVQIGFDDLCGEHRLDIQTLRYFVDLIAGVLCSREDVIKVNGELHPMAEVQARFMQLDKEHIDYVLECLDKNTSDIRNLRAYMLTTLYNAPGSITAYYDAKVRHDMAQPYWYQSPYSRRAS